MRDPVISAADLRELLSAPDRVTVLDVRWRLGGPAGEPEHRAGHVPGAVYVDLDADLAAPPGAGGRHPLPDAAAFEAAMRRAGVDDGVPVVVYDDWSAHAAARAWWLLRHHGHADVRVLDGGWSAWVAAGGEVETGPVPPPAPGDLTARPGAMPVLDADGAAVAARSGVLVDARADVRHRGEHEPVDPVAGHVPGAVNVATSLNLDAGGRFRPVEELREVYAAVGALEPDAEVAVYCGSGVTAAHDVLALERLGVRAALYPGSWSGWITDPARPVARTGRTDDVEALVALAERVWPVAYAVDPAYARLTLDTWWTPEATRTSVAETHWVVVERDGVVVAAGNLDPRTDVPTLWKLLVDPAEQGRGTGTAVLEELARSAGDRGVRLSYVEANTPAAAFYAARGFRVVDRTPADGPHPAQVVVQRG